MSLYLRKLEKKIERTACQNTGSARNNYFFRSFCPFPFHSSDIIPIFATERVIMIMSEDIGIPIFGPKTIEEAINRVDQAWAERNDPNKWITSEQMWNRLYEKYPWLR